MPRSIAHETRSILHVTRYLGGINRAFPFIFVFAICCLFAPPVAAATGYADNADGTVTDQATGLIWKRCVEGQTWTGSTCSGTPTSYTWSQAGALTGTFAGSNAWRLPSVSDLQSIVDMSASNPTINATAFPNAPSSVFWSATAEANNPDNGLYVSFIYGNSSTLDKTSTFYARLVRGTASTTGGGTTGGGAGSLSIVPSLETSWNLLGNSLGTAFTVSALYGDSNVVNTVWKWDAAVLGWQFYTPSLTEAELQTYATSKGYGVLSAINPGEGYWVNARAKATLATQTGAPFSLAANNLVTGWNLVATADDVSPPEFNRRLSPIPPSPGVTPINFTTLWAWDNATSNWYFYAPSLDSNGTLAGYITSKGYLDFALRGKTLGNGTGFWVNSTAATVPVAPSLTIGLTDSAGVAITNISSNIAATVTATVADATGAAVPNVIVTFSTEATFATISPATALTNAAGVATVTISPAGTAGASAVTATTEVGTETVTGSKGYTVTIADASSASPKVTVALTDSAGTSITNISGTASATVTATVTDATGAAVANTIVTFSTEAIFGTIAPTTALTNAAGVATATMNLTGTAGASTVTATTQVGTALVTGSKNYAVVPAATAPSINVALTDNAGASITTISSGTSATVKATVTNAAGGAIANTIVAFSTDAMFGTITPATALTNAAGVATATISAVGNPGATTVIATTVIGTATITGSMHYTIATAVPNLTVALTDSAGATVTNISGGTPATIKATVTDAAGAAVAGAIVSFSTDPAFGTITPASATALTDATGVASATLNTASLTAAGASTVTARSQIGTTSVTGTVGYSVGAAVVTVGNLSFGVGAGPLSAFGTTSVSVSVFSNGVLVTTPQTVTFTSSCASNDKAVLTASVATVNGVASASYRDNGCGSDDIVTASVSGIASTAATLTVTPPAAGSIQFVSATPGSLSLKGIGGTEASQVSFKVLDTSGKPVSGKQVTFTLNTTLGGIALTPTTSATSDADGLVVVNVNSGTVSTPVRVTASIAGTTLTSQSSALSISTGIPDQDSFSLSATKLNPEFLEIDGNTTIITARLADHFNNPVPNGTIVNFTTEGGSIVASCSTVIDSNGSSNCSSTLTSQEPRPANGRVTILAYAQGEESFIDLNGNGVADLGEFTDLPEAWRDDNENGARDLNETFIDFNQDNAYNGADSQYSGVLCDNVTAPPKGSSLGLCATSKTRIVSKSIAIVFSGSTPFISKISPATIDLVGGCSGTSRQVDLRIVDTTGNPLPVGTTIVVTTTDGTISGTGSFVQANTNVTPAAGVANYSVFIRDDSVAGESVNPVTGVSTPTCTDATLSGVLTVTVSTPGGVVRIAEYAVSN